MPAYNRLISLAAAFPDIDYCVHSAAFAKILSSTDLLRFAPEYPSVGDQLGSGDPSAKVQQRPGGRSPPCAAIWHAIYFWFLVSTSRHVDFKWTRVDFPSVIIGMKLWRRYAQIAFARDWRFAIEDNHQGYILPISHIGVFS
ncbi:hypothetical protein [Rhizobium sp. BR 362]|uniref:hypothetical protein n=1 Tax=Rhizobium sp. BR 362 TaxID=3040670 RepID=UPI002F3E7F2A